jgi:hypothetical protein
MPITAACPSCSQKLQVDDQYAGKPVRCPKCGNTMTMPRADVPTAQVVSEPPLAAPMLVPTDPLLPGALGAGFIETVQRSLAALGLDALSTKLFYAGVSCLAGMIVFTFLPWFSPGIVTVLGISVYPGILNFLLSAGGLGFVVVTLVVIKKKETFDIGLWTVAGWAALASLWRLVDVARLGTFSGIGLYLTLLASLGAAGTFGYIIFQRFVKKRM